MDPFIEALIAVAWMALCMVVNSKAESCYGGCDDKSDRREKVQAREERT